MTDFGHLPLDPYKRTTTTFRPYSTVPSGGVRSTVVPRTASGQPSGDGQGWMAPIGLVVAIASIVGIGIHVNGASSEPSAPNVEQSTLEAVRADDQGG